MHDKEVAGTRDEIEPQKFQSQYKVHKIFWGSGGGFKLGSVGFPKTKIFLLDVSDCAVCLQVVFAGATGADSNWTRLRYVTALHHRQLHTGNGSRWRHRAAARQSCRRLRQRREDLSVSQRVVSAWAWGLSTDAAQSRRHLPQTCELIGDVDRETTGARGHVPLTFSSEGVHDVVCPSLFHA